MGSTFTTKWTETHIIALDLEGSGDRASENPAVEIGAVLKDPSGKTLSKFHEIGRCDSDQYEPRCEREFWDKIDTDRKKRKRYSEAQDACMLWRHFYDWLENAIQNFPNCIVVSDNPSYDCGVSNYNFDRYFHGKSMHYVGGNGYVKIRDVHSAVEPLAEKANMERSDFERRILVNFYMHCSDVEKSEHTHSALDDANRIANIWLAMIQHVKSCKRDE